MKLENVETAIAKTGNPYLKLTIDGKIYNFFGEIADDIAIGDIVQCEFETKGKFTNLKAIRKGSAPSIPQLTEIRHDVVLNRTEKPHSYEFGPANARHKIYYGEVAELKAQIEALKEFGFIAEIPNV